MFVFLFLWLALLNFYNIPYSTFCSPLDGKCSQTSISKDSSVTTASSSDTSKNSFVFKKSSQFDEAVQQYLQFTDAPSTLKSLTLTSDFRNSRFWTEYLKPMLVPRVPGTDSHTRVREFLVSTLKKLGFQVEEDVFEATTPLGRKTFRNIIATRFPGASQTWVWAAHYDSKEFPNSRIPFVGATDSAAPCAILLEVAARMQPIWDQISTSKYAIQFVFFDGEEAFKDWSSTDSIYGARHLAQKWESEEKLARIHSFILLDLLGEKGLSLKPFPKTTQRAAPFSPDVLFQQLEHLETKLRKEKRVHVQSMNVIFNTKGTSSAGIEDDHVPFQEKGVPILHLIPYPFPSVWHKLEDNEKALDPQTLENLVIIFTGLTYTQTVHA
ncbi:hypothetical protein HMI54_000484 [Coelomomyces lativittatus]|nr:hypothetical protein HMI54_000484 [Coelomomyces lativittatus]